MLITSLVLAEPLEDEDRSEAGHPPRPGDKRSCCRALCHELKVKQILLFLLLLRMDSAVLLFQSCIRCGFCCLFSFPAADSDDGKQAKATYELIYVKLG
jgi:hypothetical protein